MKWPYLVLAVCGIALAISTVAAQNAPLPPIKTPTLQRAPELASWTISFKYSNAGTAQHRRTDPDPVQSITVTKAGTTYREQIAHASGQTGEKWIFEDAQLQIVKGGFVVIVETPSTGKSSPEFNDYNTCDFGGMEWVSPSHFRSAQPYQGRAAYLFEVPKGQGKATAVLSADTQWPLLYSDEEVTCTYTFNAPPQELTPPEKILTILKKHKAGLQKLKLHSSPP